MISYNIFFIKFFKKEMSFVLCNPHVSKWLNKFRPHNIISNLSVMSSSPPFHFQSLLTGQGYYKNVGYEIYASTSCQVLFHSRILFIISDYVGTNKANCT